MSSSFSSSSSTHRISDYEEEDEEENDLVMASRLRTHCLSFLIDCDKLLADGR